MQAIILNNQTSLIINIQSMCIVLHRISMYINTLVSDDLNINALHIVFRCCQATTDDLSWQLTLLKIKMSLFICLN